MPSSHTPSHLSSKRAIRPPWYYRLIISILKPLYRLQVWRRSHKLDNYKQEVAQRFGKHYPPRPVSSMRSATADNLTQPSDSNLDSSHSKSLSSPNDKVIWCHAVSLGETNTIAPMLDALLAKGYQIWLTNTTQTGYARGASRFADAIAQGQMSHSYVPVDTPNVIETFLAHVQPIAALFVETELWANSLAVLSWQNIPSILVNGRLSESSFNGYQKIAAVSRSMMQNLTLIIAQDKDSAKHFRQLGASSAKIRLAGSLKWVINTAQMNTKEDNVHTQSDSQRLATKRPIWVAASTHEGEEETALSWQQQILSAQALSSTLLIIVPRHPERFDEVASLIERSGLQMARRSRDEDITAQTQVYLADSMGELMRWYAEADVALVGGSLVDIGGHNPVEPSSVATPVIMGQYTQSCQSVVDQLASVGALYQPRNRFYQPTDGNCVEANKNKHDKGHDNALMYEQLKFWLSHLPKAKQAGQSGKQLTEQQQSVLTQQLSIIEAVIDRGCD